MLCPLHSAGWETEDRRRKTEDRRSRSPVSGRRSSTSRPRSPVLQSRSAFHRPLHLQECFKGLGYNEGALPVSERASKEVLSLPVFPELTEKEQIFVAQGIRAFIEG